MLTFSVLTAKRKLYIGVVGIQRIARLSVSKTIGIKNTKGRAEEKDDQHAFNFKQ